MRTVYGKAHTIAEDGESLLLKDGEVIVQGEADVVIGEGGGKVVVRKGGRATVVVMGGEAEISAVEGGRARVLVNRDAKVQVTVDKGSVEVVS